MDTHALQKDAEQRARAQAESADRAAAYPFPTGDTGPIGPEAATSIHVLDDAPGARAGGAEARVEDLHEGLAQRDRDHEPGRAQRDRDQEPQTSDAPHHRGLQDQAATEARVASAQQRRRDAYAALSGRSPYDFKSLVIAVGAGFLIGAWWAGGRR